MIAALIALQLSAVTIPYSWLEYCHRSGDHSCAVEKIEPLDLAYLNKLISETIETKLDASPLDPWVAFPADRKGDCDDDTVTKRAALIALGMDPKAMRIELGEVTEPDGRTAGHAVLVVTLPNKNGEGFTEWVMDRKTPDQLYPIAKRPYAWRPLARQSPSVVRWDLPDGAAG